jgi:hypothetical protein
MSPVTAIGCLKTCRYMNTSACIAGCRRP